MMLALLLTSIMVTASSTNVGDSIGTVTGSPTWKYLLFDYDGGLVAIDTSGKAVWSCSNCGEARDQLPNGNLVTIVHGTGLVEKDSSCKNVKTVNTYHADGHEARIDQTDSSKVVGITPQGCAKKWTDIGCQGIIYWDTDKKKDSMPIDLGEYFDPSKDWGYLSTKADWMHTNCAGTGSKDNFIVGIRHLSAIVSFDKSTNEKQWVLSSEITSNFTFANDSDKFYSAHDAHQLPNGNILLYDNGNKRNGAPALSRRLSATGHCADVVAKDCPNLSGSECKQCVTNHTTDLKKNCRNFPHDAVQACSSTPTPSPSPSPTPSGHKYSRALEYALDFDSMTVKIVYEFRTEASHFKGAARRLSNGNTLVTCPECSPSSTNGVVYEANADAKEVSRVELAQKGQSVYRAQAIDTIPSTGSEIIV